MININRAKLPVSTSPPPYRRLSTTAAPRSPCSSWGHSGCCSSSPPHPPPASSRSPPCVADPSASLIALPSPCGRSCSARISAPVLAAQTCRRCCPHHGCPLLRVFEADERRRDSGPSAWLLIVIGGVRRRTRGGSDGGTRLCRNYCESLAKERPYF